MRPETDAGVRDGALIVAKARAAGLAVEVHAAGRATLVTCSEVLRANLERAGMRVRRLMEVWGRPGSAA
jgi:hypothetical protein